MRTHCLAVALLGTLLHANTGAPPLATLAGKAVDESALNVGLREIAGAVVLEEAALDAALEARMAREGLTLPPGAVDAEERRLMMSVADEAGANPEQAASLIDRLRRTRGLGPERYRRLLERNARLRTLLGSQITLSPEEQAAAVELDFGARHRARVVLTASRERASAVVAAMHAANRDARPPAAVMAELAMDLSEDASGPRGGLLPQASPADLSLPAGVRSALRTLRPGECSDVIAVDRGYAVVLVERESRPPRTPDADELARTLAKARARLERLAMDRLARELLDATDVTVFDASLRWSWEGRPR
jgi:hypothetical protein